MSVLLKIYPENPSEKKLQEVVDCLKNGGVIIYPTDTVYAIGCDINNSKAIDRISQITGDKPGEANFSLIFYDLSHLSDYCKVDDNTFKLIRKALPGPFTFILEAKNNIPKIFKSKKKTVGIRIPDNTIPREIVKLLGNPIMTTSVHDDDEVIDYTTNPELIHEKYRKQVDIVIDGGFGGNEPSTVVDCSNGEPIILRQGKGDINEF